MTSKVGEVELLLKPLAFRAKIEQEYSFPASNGPTSFAVIEGNIKYPTEEAVSDEQTTI